MRRTFSYRKATALLGGESALTGLIDKFSSVALLGLGAVSLIDARVEAVKLADGLIRGLRDRVQGLSRYDRTERVLAAHAVIVVTAYFEALEELKLISRGAITKDDQKRLVGRDPAAHWVEQLIEADLPYPAPQRPYEEVLAELRVTFARFSTELLSLVSGLAIWDRLDETERGRARRSLMETLPDLACRRYEERFRIMCKDFPEVACWTDRVEHQATRAAVRHLWQGLAGLEEELKKIKSGREPSDRLAALVGNNRATLSHPIIKSADVPEGMTIPPLGHAYVNPGFRVLPPGRDRRPADEGSWNGRLSRRDDLNEFLTGCLTAPQATEVPLLVLGQPGAGKSVLTKMLAARLPPGDFLALRVELRNFPVDSGLLKQIEDAIKAVLDESMSWPELVQAAGDALPVVMLDGFDELLQATGVSQTDYLERIVEFQQVQAERGRPLAVIVTSRTAVANRARVPDESLVLRLEPFDESQIRHWVGVWNRSNERYFTTRDLRPLSIDDVLVAADLAEQPLLLLMLALYDASDNALIRSQGELREADLYERLLVEFTKREVRKPPRQDLSAQELARAVEDELHKLAITAFAMFNRRRQWVSEEELDNDLMNLLYLPERSKQPSGFRRSLTEAEGVIASFFFVHKSKAQRDDQRLETYEFLHATFGEYLITRLITRELVDFAGELALAESRNRPTRPDDTFLHALLSFALLTERTPILDFLKYGILSCLTEDMRESLGRYLCEQFAESLQARSASGYDNYEPISLTVPARYALYSANLLLLCALVANRPLRGTDILNAPAEDDWHRIATLWKSQLTHNQWDTLVQTVRFRRSTVDFTIHLNGQDPFELANLHVTFSGGDEAIPVGTFAIPADHSASSLLREIMFRDDELMTILFASMAPYAEHLGDPIQDFIIDPDLGTFIPAAELLTLLMSPHRDRLMSAYARAFCASGEMSDRYKELIFAKFAEDLPLLPSKGLLELFRGHAFRAVGSSADRDELRRLLRRLRDRPDIDAALYREVERRLDMHPAAGLELPE